MNTRGSILQIVLYVFLIMTFSLTSFASYAIRTANIKKAENRLNAERLIEILMVRHMRQERHESILLSDEFTYDQGSVRYTVDEMGTYDLIYETITINGESYMVEIKMDHETLRLLSYRYT